MNISRLVNSFRQGRQTTAKCMLQEVEALQHGHRHITQIHSARHKLGCWIAQLRKIHDVVYLKNLREAWRAVILMQSALRNANVRFEDGLSQAEKQHYMRLARIALSNLKTFIKKDLPVLTNRHILDSVVKTRIRGIKAVVSVG